MDCIGKPFKVRDLVARVHLQVQLGKRLIKLQEDFEDRSRELETLIELSTVRLLMPEPKLKLIGVMQVGIFRTDATGK